MRRLPSTLIVGASILLVAVGLSVWAKFQSAEEETWTPLALRVPMVIEGWKGENLPLGETEAVRDAVGKLNYHDYLYRVYRKDGREIFLYAMYWKQGGISVREMAGHTPDGCWIANGAKQGTAPKTVSIRVGNRDAAPAEVRTFVFPSGGRVETAWWHIWGSNLVDRSFAEKSIMPAVKEIWAWLGKRRGARRGQLLVRVHTLGSLDEAISSPATVDFLGQFPEAFSATPLYAP